MFKPTVQFNDYVSLAVMLLMVVALVAGQADASAHTEQDVISVAPLTAPDERTDIRFESQLGEEALKISIAIVTDLGHFRGEDE